MPCYEIRTVSVEFKASNVNLLKKAIENLGIKISNSTEKTISFYNVGKYTTIDIEKQQIVGSGMNERQLSTFSNAIKRAYSEQVIDEIAKKQKWMKSKLSQNKFQLKRF